jgi:hypothetical protein
MRPGFNEEFRVIKRKLNSVKMPEYTIEEIYRALDGQIISSRQVPVQGFGPADLAKRINKLTSALDFPVVELTENNTKYLETKEFIPYIEATSTSFTHG